MEVIRDSAPSIHTPKIYIFQVLIGQISDIESPSSHMVATRETSISSVEGPLTCLQRSVRDVFVNL